MTIYGESVAKNRNRNYEDTHRKLIETAGELFLQQGAGAVSVAALARATRIHRTTIYYHFDTRKEMLSAAKEWCAEHMAQDDDANFSRWVGIDQISDFFQRDPNVIASCIESYVAVGDIRQRFPQWDRLVERIGNIFAELAADEPCDPEVYCALMLTGAVSVPRAVSSAVHPFASLERVLERFQASASEHTVM